MLLLLLFHRTSIGFKGRSIWLGYLNIDGVFAGLYQGLDATSLAYLKHPFRLFPLLITILHFLYLLLQILFSLNVFEPLALNYLGVDHGHLLKVLLLLELPLLPLGLVHHSQALCPHALLVLLQLVQFLSYLSLEVVRHAPEFLGFLADQGFIIG